MGTESPWDRFVETVLVFGGDEPVEVHVHAGVGPIAVAGACGCGVRRMRDRDFGERAAIGIGGLGDMKMLALGVNNDTAPF